MVAKYEKEKAVVHFRGFTSMYEKSISYPRNGDRDILATCLMCIFFLC